jgi:hypothetical protein
MAKNRQGKDVPYSSVAGDYLQNVAKATQDMVADYGHMARETIRETVNDLTREDEPKRFGR